MKKYNVAIIGGGPSGIFAAHELNNLNPDANIIMMEKGNSIFKRKCPIIEHKVDRCINCESCFIMHGFGGAGAFSDGKFNFTTQFGGWLNDYLSDKELLDLIEYVDGINVGFGATKKRYSTDSPKARELEKKALENDLHLLKAQVKHLGTENNLEILKKQYEYLKERIELRCNTQVDKIEKANGGFKLTINGGDTIECDYLIAAPGRSGAEWFAGNCSELGLKLINNQ